MIEKPRNDRPIDKVRNSGGSMKLPEGAGEIDGMQEIDGSLHFIARRAIVRMQLADQIDPERVNIHIPNTQQFALDHGTDSLYVQQLLMTGRRLFMEAALGDKFDKKAAFTLTFDALKDLVAMHKMSEELNRKMDKITEDLKGKTVAQIAQAMPTVGDVRAVTESFLQKADHIVVDYFNLAKVFYGEIGNRWFSSLQKLILEKHGEDHQFTKFISDVLPLLQFVKNARNLIEHPKQDQRVNVTDITFLPTAELRPPAIEVIHPETPQPSVALGVFMGHLIDHLGAIGELLIVHMAGANVQPFAGVQLGIMQYDERMQKAYMCRFGYGTRMGDQIVPFG